MVRAIDEYRGAPESGNKAATDKTPNDARLTTMPQCLMHWWTPILIAGFLFVGTTLCAFWWEWHFHWPSVQAMQLCATAAGVGFGLAAWQQRSHDNAAQAQQAHATEEREEYGARLSAPRVGQPWTTAGRDHTIGRTSGQSRAQSAHTHR